MSETEDEMTMRHEIESLKAKLAATADLRARVAQLEDALHNLLQDTQHSEHNCYSNDCPVVKARQAVSTTHQHPIPYKPHVQKDG